MSSLHQSKTKDERPYATALGFYLGDSVDMAEIEQEGYICKVFGSDSHTCEVQFDSGMRAEVEDFDLTRIR